jgi:hypothetical protein
LTSKETRAKSKDPTTTCYSSERWDVLVKVIVNLATIILLVLPTTLLYVLDMDRASILTILAVFVVIFNISIASLTNAKRHEMFAATAA